MSQSHAGRTGWPTPWMVALAALGLFWFAYGMYLIWVRNVDETFFFRPYLLFVLAGLNVMAGYGLVRGGLIGRVVAALVALAGATPVILWALIIAVMAVTDPHGTSLSLTSDSVVGYPTWIFIALVLAIVGGYGLVLVRAIRGR
jgi:hypothetical protein